MRRHLSDSLNVLKSIAPLETLRLIVEPIRSGIRSGAMRACTTVTEPASRVHGPLGSLIKKRA